MFKNTLLVFAIFYSSNSLSQNLDLDELLIKIEEKYTVDVMPSQYMRSIKNCKQTAKVFEGWENFPVQECIYTSYQMKIPVTTKAYLLFPDAKKLAKWTVNACVDTKSSNVELCALSLVELVNSQSNAQFPVAGFVVEKPGSGFIHQDQPYCYLFRDGVTVTTKSWPETVMHINHACGSDDVNDEPVIKAFNYGRVSSVTRCEYKKAKGLGCKEDKGSTNPAFAKVIGEEFRKAWDSDRNFLFYASALSLTKNL